MSPKLQDVDRQLRCAFEDWTTDAQRIADDCNMTSRQNGWGWPYMTANRVRCRLRNMGLRAT